MFRGAGESLLGEETPRPPQVELESQAKMKPAFMSFSLGISLAFREEVVKRVVQI